MLSLMMMPLVPGRWGRFVLLSRRTAGRQGVVGCCGARAPG